MMLASCCGHGKTDGRIDLVDGRVLMIVPPKQSEDDMTDRERERLIKALEEAKITPSVKFDLINETDELYSTASTGSTVKCPECGDSEHYRIIYTDDEMTEVKFYDCLMCRHHWK